MGFWLGTVICWGYEYGSPYRVGTSKLTTFIDDWFIFNILSAYREAELEETH